MLRILDASEELEHLLGNAWPALREELTDLVLRLDVEGETASLRRKSDAFLARLIGSPAGTRVQAFVRDAPSRAASSGRRSAVPSPSTSARTLPHARLGYEDRSGATHMVSAAGEQLQATIARRWREIELCFDTAVAWRSFSGKLLALLRQLDEPGTDADKTMKGIQELFAQSPAAHEVPKRDFAPKAGPSRSRRLNSPWAADDTKAAASPALPSRHTLISVLYGTDRVPLEAKDGRARYDNEGAKSLSFGVATVSIPDKNTHVKGRLERPRWYRLEFRENVDKHIVIISLEQVDEEQFVKRAGAARESDGSNDEALLFVYGFNVGFEDSIRRTAQFAADLEFAGLSIAYSWPSKGSLFGYHTDGDVSESSMFRLAEFIAFIRAKLGLKRLNIVAHSMGNRVLARALNQHVLTALPDPGATLNQVVFAAPDINPTTFGGFAEVFAESCERCTLYASAHDMALTASKWIYKRSRAGADVRAVIEYGVDAIDASRVDDSMLGHSYFSDKRVLLQDLSELLFSGRAPDKRYGLAEIVVGNGRYWQFKA